MRHFLDILDVNAEELKSLLLEAARLKAAHERREPTPLLQGRVLGLIFEKPSLRTRVSFETAMAQLGGASVFLSGAEAGMGTRESVPDFARVMSQYVDGVVLRTFQHATVETFAAHATLPVINGLSDYCHPCQALGDLLTMQEVFGNVAGRTIVFVGDGNNVARSLALGCGKLGVRFILAVPEDGPFPQAEEIDRYRNALHYSDAALGQLLHGLRKRGLYENTLFIIMGDHGEAFEQHSGNYGHTLFIYEENVRVPLVVAAPGAIHDPLQVDRVASLIDTAPTVLDLLGLPIPSTYQGRSLLDSQSGMALFCTDYSLGLLGLRDGRWKCIHEVDSGRTMLFDLREDSDEKTDLAGLYPERVEAYRDHLLRWAAAQKYQLTR